MDYITVEAPEDTNMLTEIHFYIVSDADGICTSIIMYKNRTLNFLNIT
jgi:hypothetical protein